MLGRLDVRYMVWVCCGREWGIQLDVEYEEIYGAIWKRKMVMLRQLFFPPTSGEFIYIPKCARLLLLLQLTKQHFHVGESLPGLR